MDLAGTIRARLNTASWKEQFDELTGTHNFRLEMGFRKVLSIAGNKEVCVYRLCAFQDVIVIGIETNTEMNGWMH